MTDQMPSRLRLRVCLAAAFVLALSAAAPARAEVEITLSRSFIEKYKNRVTISTDFRIDAAKSKPNAASADGDLHVAGRPGTEIGLVTVAEIQNARDVPNAVAFVREQAGNDQPVKLTGVWRVWFEHAGGDSQVQGRPLKKLGINQTNPDHLFEIHPVTSLGGLDLIATLKPIPGYDKPNNSGPRFQMLEHMRSKLRVTEKTVTVQASGNSPNYIRFLFKKLPGKHGYQRADGSWTQPADGLFLFGKLYDTDEEVQVRKRRVGFVKGSEPFDLADGLPDNRCLDILGITRMNLELVSWRVRNAAKRPDVLGWNLPYEIVAVGVEGKATHCASEEDE